MSNLKLRSITLPEVSTHYTVGVDTEQGRQVSVGETTLQLILNVDGTLRISRDADPVEQQPVIGIHALMLGLGRWPASWKMHPLTVMDADQFGAQWTLNVEPDTVHARLFVELEGVRTEYGLSQDEAAAIIVACQTLMEPNAY